MINAGEERTRLLDLRGSKTTGARRAWSRLPTIGPLPVWTEVHRTTSIRRLSFALRDCHAPERVHGAKGFKSRKLLFVSDIEGSGKGKGVEGNVLEMLP